MIIWRFYNHATVFLLLKRSLYAIKTEEKTWAIKQTTRKRWKKFPQCKEKVWSMEIKPYSFTTNISNLIIFICSLKNNFYVCSRNLPFSVWMQFNWVNLFNNFFSHFKIVWMFCAVLWCFHGDGKKFCLSLKIWYLWHWGTKNWNFHKII